MMTMMMRTFQGDNNNNKCGTHVHSHFCHFHDEQCIRRVCRKINLWDRVRCRYR